MKKGRGISLLVPFRCEAKSQREKNWQWLHKYWNAQLPGAEVIIGVDPISESHSSLPFSKEVNCGIPK